MPLPRRHAPRRIPSTVTAAVVALATGLLLVPAAPAQAASDRASTVRWASAAQLKKGTFDGVRLSGSALVLSSPRQKLTYTDPYGTRRKTTWSAGSWTSPWTSTGFGARTLIPSWSAKLPKGTWLRVVARVRSGSTVGSWDRVASWGYGTAGVYRASGEKQADDLSWLDTDTLKANGSRTFDQWQVRVHLVRKPGSTATPVVESVHGAAASYATRSIATSRTTMSRTKILDVPRYSQMTHRGHHPEWGGGGEAWCSPTSVAMVLGYFRSGPAKSDYSWTKGADGQVDHAARYSYDYRYKGTGNWPFSAGYAGQLGLSTFVTRLYDLREAEAFIKAGIPLVASVAFGRGELSGAPISSTPGHLMVISGFTRTGKVVVNDPAGSANSNVRRTYSRAEFERAWLRGSGGVVYVLRPPSKALPKDTARW
jgi:hypothetical protein